MYPISRAQVGFARLSLTSNYSSLNSVDAPVCTMAKQVANIAEKRMLIVNNWPVFLAGGNVVIDNRKKTDTEESAAPHRADISNRVGR